MATCAMGNASSPGSSSSVSSSSSSYNEGSNSPIRSPDTTTETTTDDLNGGPFLQIIEEPIDRFRFRYKTEMQGTHGAILASNNQRSKAHRTFPKVKLCNYANEKARPNPIIRCTLYTSEEDEDRRVAHVHRLIKKDKNSRKELDDPHDITIYSPAYTALFENMTILFTKKEEQEKVLIEKKHLQNKRRFTDPKSIQLPYESSDQLKRKVNQELSFMNLNVACLRFEALIDNGHGKYEPLCRPVYSKPINNMKNPQTNELRICRVDKCTGSCLGDEEVFMFVEKVVKKNIKVKFYEEGPNKDIVWVDYGLFTPEDVHHQYGIAFRTPRYRDPNITNNVEVYFQLERPSDNAVSEPLLFEYRPNPHRLRDMNRKRPRQESEPTLPAMLNDFPQKPQLCSQEPVPNQSCLQDPLMSSTNEFEELVQDDLLRELIKDLTEMPMEQEDAISSMGSNMSFGKILENLPSADSEAVSQFLSSGRIEEYALLNGEDEAVKILKNSTGQGPSSDLVFDGFSKLPRRITARKILLPFKPATQAFQIKKDYNYCGNPQSGPAVAVAHHQMYCGDPQSGPAVAVAHHQMYCGDPQSGPAVAVAHHQMYCPSETDCQGNEVNIRGSIEQQTHLLNDSLHRKLGVESDNERLDKSMNEVSIDYRENTKHDSTHSLCEKLGASKLYESDSDNLVEAQMEGPRTVPRRTSSKLMLNESNIVEKVDKALSNLLKLKNLKKIKEKLLMSCLVRLFSFTVEDCDDSVLHVLARSNQTPLPVQAPKFLNLLKIFNVIDKIINIQNNKNETPLLVAAERGNPEMVSLLLEAGADVNATDAKNNTAMHLAVLRESDSMDILAALLSKYPNLARFNEDGYTVLHLAVNKRKSDIISSLLVKSEDNMYNNEDLVNSKDRKRGNTALHMAVEYRFKEIVNLLLNFEEVIKIDTMNFDGKTPLAFVLGETDVLSKEIADLLLSNQADISLVASDKAKKDGYKDEYNTEPDLEIMDADLDESESAYAREWENTELFDKTTISKLCPLLDENGDWRLLCKKLNYSTSEIDYCKIHWSPTLFAFKVAGLNKPEITAEVVRDELYTLAPHLRCGAQFIDDMLLQKLGLE